jgi:hypothetical protein
VAEERQYRATLRYESAQVVTEPAASQDAALRQLVATLHGQGYRHLKMQISFREGTYLGSRESWTEFPDPLPAHRSVVAAIRDWIRRAKDSI